MLDVLWANAHSQDDGSALMQHAPLLALLVPEGHALCLVQPHLGGLQLQVPECVSVLLQVVEPGFICRWFYDVHTKKLYKLDEALSDNSEVDEESRSKLQLLLQRTKDRMVESQLRDAAARDQQEGVDQETGADAAAGDQDALTDDDDDGQDDEAGPSNRRQRAARAKQQVASAGDADHGGDSVDAGQRRKKVVLPISDDEDE